MVENSSSMISVPSLTDRLDEKLNYLSNLRQAVQVEDDRLIYELLQNKKYHKEISKETVNDNDFLSTMITDLQPMISHLLSKKLINYLSQVFPFFYYKEISQGTYQIYFGNWWDRRKFGLLDVLNIKLIFDENEYEKLSKSIELSKNNQRLNANKIETLTNENEQLQKLIDSQSKRDVQKGTIQTKLDEITNAKQGIFSNTKVNEQRDELVEQLEKIQEEDEKASLSRTKIIENNDEILFLSKEDTILRYEQKSIDETFGDFSKFEKAVDTLYVTYISTFLNN